MSYVAIHHTEIAGCLYTPGEVISKPIPAEKAERLIGLGAIEPLMKMVPAHVAEPENAAAEPAQETTFEAENDNAHPSEEDEAFEEDAEDVAVPVVDVMDGIVAPEPIVKTAAKPKTNSRRNKA